MLIPTVVEREKKTKVPHSSHAERRPGGIREERTRFEDERLKEVFCDEVARLGASFETPRKARPVVHAQTKRAKPPVESPESTMSTPAASSPSEVVGVEAPRGVVVNVPTAAASVPVLPATIPPPSTPPFPHEKQAVPAPVPSPFPVRTPLPPPTPEHGLEEPSSTGFYRARASSRVGDAGSAMTTVPSSPSSLRCFDCQRLDADDLTLSSTVCEGCARPLCPQHAAVHVEKHATSGGKGGRPAARHGGDGGSQQGRNDEPGFIGEKRASQSRKDGEMVSSSPAGRPHLGVRADRIGGGGSGRSGPGFEFGLCSIHEGRPVDRLCREHWVLLCSACAAEHTDHSGRPCEVFRGLEPTVVAEVVRRDMRRTMRELEEECARRTHAAAEIDVGEASLKAEYDERYKQLEAESTNVLGRMRGIGKIAQDCFQNAKTGSWLADPPQVLTCLQEYGSVMEAAMDSGDNRGIVAPFKHVINELRKVRNLPGIPSLASLKKVGLVQALMRGRPPRDSRPVICIVRACPRRIFRPRPNGPFHAAKWYAPQAGCCTASSYRTPPCCHAFLGAETAPKTHGGVHIRTPPFLCVCVALVPALCGVFQGLLAQNPDALHLILRAETSTSRLSPNIAETIFVVGKAIQVLVQNCLARQIQPGFIVIHVFLDFFTLAGRLLAVPALTQSVAAVKGTILAILSVLPSMAPTVTSTLAGATITAAKATIDGLTPFVDAGVRARLAGELLQCETWLEGALQRS